MILYRSDTYRDDTCRTDTGSLHYLANADAAIHLEESTHATHSVMCSALLAKTLESFWKNDNFLFWTPFDTFRSPSETRGDVRIDPNLHCVMNFMFQTYLLKIFLLHYYKFKFESYRFLEAFRFRGVQESPEMEVPKWKSAISGSLCGANPHRPISVCVPKKSLILNEKRKRDGHLEERCSRIANNGRNF